MRGNISDGIPERKDSWGGSTQGNKTDKLPSFLEFTFLAEEMDIKWLVK